jgi:hypothetical protein
MYWKMGKRQGQLALPFLFLSFGNLQLKDHPAFDGRRITQSILVMKAGRELFTS